MKHYTTWSTVLWLLLLTVPAAAGGEGETLPPLEPISAWMCDDGVGTTAMDEFDTRHGELEGGMGDSNWTSATPFAYAGNSALSFDGGNDRVEVNDNNIVAGRENMSISVWFNWAR